MFQTIVEGVDSPSEKSVNPVVFPLIVTTCTKLEFKNNTKADFSEKAVNYCLRNQTTNSGVNPKKMFGPLLGPVWSELPGPPYSRT